MHRNPYKIRWIAEKYQVRDALGVPTEDLIYVPKYDEVVVDGNRLLNQGRDMLNQMLIGQGTPTPLSAQTALVHVGDGGQVGEAATQTDLQGTGAYNDLAGQPHKWKKGMEPGFPQIIVASGVVRFKSRFLSEEANFTWSEFGVSNGTILFNRKIA